MGESEVQCRFKKGTHGNGDEQSGKDSFSAAILGQLEELERFAEFVNDHPGIVELSQLELENNFLEQRTRELSEGTLPAIVVGGVGEDNSRERNERLHERLQMARAVRIRDGLTVGEALAGRSEFGGRCLFHAITDAF